MHAHGEGAVRARRATRTHVIGFLVAALTATVGFGSPARSDTGSTCDVNPLGAEDAITQAIASCPDGSTVRFPEGMTYFQADKIAVVGRRDLVIDGNGSTFVSTAPNDPWASIYDARPNWEIVESTNVTVENMTIVGNLLPGPRGILPGNQYNAGIIIYGGDTVSVADVSVYSVFGEFVVVNPSGFYHGLGALDGQVPRNVEIDRLYGKGAGRQCVAVTAVQGFSLRDSTLGNCYQNGVDIEPDVAGEPLHDIHIVGNVISDYYFAGVVVSTAYAAGDVQGIEVTGNTVHASDTCYPAVMLGGVQANDNPLYDIVVADNTLETLNEGVRATDVVTGTVTGNHIATTASPSLCGPPAPVPVRQLGSSNMAVYDNSSDGYAG